jgi:hypothetical protein
MRLFAEARLSGAFTTTRPAPPEAPLTLRMGREADIPAIQALILRTVGERRRGPLKPRRRLAARRLMGMDVELIADGAYLVVESAGRVVGCGGWRRATSGAVTAEAVFSDPDFKHGEIDRLILGVIEWLSAAKAG